MRIGLFGTGRLGKAIAAEAGDQVVWQVSRQDPPDVPVDVAIEATVGAAVERRVAWAIERGVPLVIGTTGWSLPDLKERIGQRTGVIVAPNFSLGVALVTRLTRVLGRFAAQDPIRDPYVIELHHARKQDAPSGTAGLLARTLLEACPRKTSISLAASGAGAIKADQLSVSVVRAGSIPGTHTVGVDLPGETIELTHTARGPAVFGQGALTAARWLLGGQSIGVGHGGQAKAKRGLFGMDDVARELLDPLFLASGPLAPPTGAAAPPMTSRESRS